MKVSVIIPVYNASAGLRQCLDSIRRQTLGELEIVCVDDGSTDGSGAILESVAAEDPRVRILGQANAGSGPARNAGMAVATGEYLAFMDADDDYPEETTLERMYAAARAAKADICGGGFMIVRGRRTITRFGGRYAGYTFPKGGMMDYADYQFDYGYHRFLYRAAFVRERSLSFPSLLRFQDPPFFVAAMIAAGRFLALDFPTYRYHETFGRVNWEKDGWRRLKDLLTGVRSVLDQARKTGLPRLEALALSRLDMDFGEELFAGVRANDDVISCLRQAAPDCLALRLADGRASVCRWRTFWLLRRVKRILGALWI